MGSRPLSGLSLLLDRGLAVRSGFAEPDEYFAQFLPGKAHYSGHAQAEQPDSRGVDDAGNKKTRQGIHIANAKIERKLAAAKGQQQQNG